MANMARAALNDRKVEVDRVALIEALKANKKEHVEQYRDALAGYKTAARRKLQDDGEKAAKRLEQNLRDIANRIDEFDADHPDKFTDHFVLIPQVLMNLPVPVCYEKEYDAAISIAEWDVNETLELTFAEFTCFVRDEWDWKDQFNTVSAMYT